jgi:hypothetical protein
LSGSPLGAHTARCPVRRAGAPQRRCFACRCHRGAPSGVPPGLPHAFGSELGKRAAAGRRRFTCNNLGLGNGQVDRLRSHVDGRVRGSCPRKILKMHRVFLRFFSGHARDHTPRRAPVSIDLPIPELLASRLPSGVTARLAHCSMHATGERAAERRSFACNGVPTPEPSSHTTTRRMRLASGGAASFTCNRWLHAQQMASGRAERARCQGWDTARGGRWRERTRRGSIASGAAAARPTLPSRVGARTGHARCAPRRERTLPWFHCFTTGRVRAARRTPPGWETAQCSHWWERARLRGPSLTNSTASSSCAQGR